MKHYDSAFMHTYPLSSKKPLVKTLKILPYALFSSIIVAFVITGFLSTIFNSDTPFSGAPGSLSFIVTSHFWIGIFLYFIIVLSIAFMYQILYVKRYFYTITDTLLVIRKGILAPREITVPFSRIQDIYLDQDIVDRMFNLYDVHISTATAESTSRAHIDGVDKDTAEALRELILHKMQGARK